MPTCASCCREPALAEGLDLRSQLLLCSSLPSLQSVHPEHTSIVHRSSLVPFGAVGAALIWHGAVLGSAHRAPLQSPATKFSHLILHEELKQAKARGCMKWGRREVLSSVNTYWEDLSPSQTMTKDFWDEKGWAEPLRLQTESISKTVLILSP